MAKKIHFINYTDPNNIGDWICSPLLHYFDFFKDYNVIRHDIDYIDHHAISKDDIVILGGGGLLNANDTWNKSITRLLQREINVTAWGVGYNTHNKSKVTTALELEKFMQISIRDYEHPSKLPWLPCVSCKAPELKKTAKEARKFGIIEHNKFPIQGADKLSFEKITNSYTIDEITDFIASTEILITNAYHMVYFAQLMGKKVICVNPFSDKFNYFKHKPQTLYGKITKSKIESVVQMLQPTPDGLLDEAIELNDSFFEKVKDNVKSKITETKNDCDYIDFYNTAFGGVGSMRGELIELRERTKIRNIISRTFKFLNF